MLSIEDIVDRVGIRRGWSRQAAAEHARSYALFLGDRDNAGVMPSEDVDAIWHEHILHTRRYREDCLALVGRFVDHEPHAGRGECSASEPPPPDLVLAECSPPNRPTPGPLPPPDFVRAECSKPEEPTPPPPDLIRAHCTKPNPEPPPGIIAAIAGHRQGPAPGPGR